MRLWYPVLFLNLWMLIFGPLVCGEHLGGHRNRRELVGVVRYLLAIDEKHRGQRDFLAWSGGQLLHRHDVTNGYSVLLAASLDDGVHRGSHSSIRRERQRSTRTQQRPTARWAATQDTARSVR